MDVGLELDSLLHQDAKGRTLDLRVHHTAVARAAHSRKEMSTPFEKSAQNAAVCWRSVLLPQICGR